MPAKTGNKRRDTQTVIDLNWDSSITSLNDKPSKNNTMPNLRVMTWNLRTFGSNTLPNDIDRIGEIIHTSGADIVCIQEVQIGALAGKKRGRDVDISPNIYQCLNDLRTVLNNLILPLGANWKYRVTGGNRGRQLEGNGMRDAYAFFYLTNPSAVPGHTLTSIDAERPAILDSSAWSGFRRPGRIHCSIDSGGTTHNVDIISIHGGTPANSIASSWTTRNLVEFAGGNFTNQVTGVVTKMYPPPTNQTIVLGDFNYTPDHGKGYDGLKDTYYTLRYAGPGGTTYSPIASNPPTRTGNIYDNILPMNVMTLPPGGATAIDFIANRIFSYLALGFSVSQAFYMLYKRQHKPGGVSDHLPVYQDFVF
jgi:endonuclease/exonuclease/phosphatase family metal-dependent hydrolase